MWASVRPGRFLLLIIDPAGHVAEFVRELNEHDVDVVVCGDPAEALARVGSLNPDAVLVAADIQPIDSATLIRVLLHRLGIPVLLGVSDQDADATATTGAVAGVTRPYQPDDVVPVLRAIRPDTATVTGPPLAAGGLRLNPATLDVRLHGRQVRLRLREFRLLQILMTNADRVVTREQIRAEVWKSATVDASNTITVHIRRLRRRLGDDPNNPSIILTVRGIGYRLEPPPPCHTAQVPRSGPPPQSASSARSVRRRQPDLRSVHGSA